ncbi:hypothetical protein Tco_0080637 [Tanacetum coccineum]
MAFPRLQELATAQNSNSLIDAVSVYIKRKINEDLHFAAGLSHLWEVLYSRVNEHSLLIAELNVFGGPLALQCAEFFKQLSQTEVLKMLEIRKSIAEVHMQVHKKIDFLTVMSFDHFDSAIYWNDGLHWLETENRQLMHYSLNIEDSDHPIITTIPIPQRGMTFLKSYGYMDPMQILIQMEFTIYEMTIGYYVWMVRYRVHTDDFMTPLPEVVWTLHEIYDCGSNQVDDNHDDNDDAADDDELL